MSRGLLIAILLATALAVQDAHAADLSTPEAAVASFFDAYARHDIEGIVSARDFDFEARESLGGAASGSRAIDDEAARRTAKAMEAALRSRIQAAGFPRFAETQCSIWQSRTMQENLVQLIRACPSPAGGTMIGSVLVAKRDEVWRVVLAPETVAASPAP
jgi:hypothetical protein